MGGRLYNLLNPVDRELQMCRSIKVLRQSDGEPSELEIREAALQFVRKISGYRHPSQANAEAFERAVDDIAGASKELLASLTQRSDAGIQRG